MRVVMIIKNMDLIMSIKVALGVLMVRTVGSRRIVVMIVMLVTNTSMFGMSKYMRKKEIKMV